MGVNIFGLRVALFGLPLKLVVRKTVTRNQNKHTTERMMQQQKAANASLEQLHKQNQAHFEQLKAKYPHIYKQEKEEVDEVCPICLEIYQDHNPAITNGGCCHTFHMHCMLEWSQRYIYSGGSRNVFLEAHLVLVAYKNWSMT